MSWLSPGEHLRTLTVDGRERRYLVYVPASAVFTRPAALHLSFHGSNSNGQIQMEFSGLNSHADQHGYALVYPFGTGQRERLLFWNAGNCCGDAFLSQVDDVAFVRALLVELERLVPVDPGRIFASGMSNGAMLAYRLANELADTIAAIAPIAGPMGFRLVAPSRPVPVIHFHGDEDEFTPYLGGVGKRSATGTNHISVPETIQAWAAANECPLQPTITTLRPTVQDGTVIELHEYKPGRDGAEVVLYLIRGGGHTWPNRPPRPHYLGKSTQNLDANETIWDFFSRHARNK